MHRIYVGSGILHDNKLSYRHSNMEALKISTMGKHANYGEHNTIFSLFQSILNIVMVLVYVAVCAAQKNPLDIVVAQT